jgi:hypothetical protein
MKLSGGGSAVGTGRGDSDGRTAGGEQVRKSMRLHQLSVVRVAAL